MLHLFNCSFISSYNKKNTKIWLDASNFHFLRCKFSFVFLFPTSAISLRGLFSFFFRPYDGLLHLHSIFGLEIKSSYEISNGKSAHGIDTRTFIIKICYEISKKQVRAGHQILYQSIFRSLFSGCETTL